MEENIRWGIVGLGNIAHSFARDMQLVSDARLAAVASRNLEKAKLFGEEFGVAQVYGSYKELFEAEDVDILYIATPHTSHAELSIEAMRHGKNVLCEKPIGLTASQAREMTAVAREQNVFLMEALWSRFNPSIARVKSLIGEGAIGEVKYLHADFAFYALDRDEKSRLLNPELAGGSLLDIGIYPIFLAYLLLGKPKRIQASALSYKTGIELQTAMIFEYPSSHALLYSGLSSRSEMKAEISGSEGSIYLQPRWHETQGYVLEKNGHKEVVEMPTTGKGYAHEIIEIHECLRAGKKEHPQWNWKNSEELMSLIDQIREETGVIFPFESQT